MYVYELIVHVIPSLLHHDSQCVIRINREPFTLSVQTERRNLPLLVWRETKEGNTIRSNGDSAFTNYFNLYKTLVKEFIVNVVPYNATAQTSLQLCFEPCSGNALYIAGIQSDRSMILQQMLRRIGVATALHGSTCSVRYEQHRLQRITNYLSITRFPESWEVLYSLQNDKQEIVCTVLKHPDGHRIGLFGIGMVVDDMQLFNSVGQRIVAEMLHRIRIADSILTSDELCCV